MVFEPPEPVLAKLTTKTLAGNHRSRIVRKHAGHRREVAYVSIDDRNSAMITAWFVLMLYRLHIADRLPCLLLTESFIVAAHETVLVTYRNHTGEMWLPLSY